MPDYTYCVRRANALSHAAAEPGYEVYNLATGRPAGRYADLHEAEEEASLRNSFALSATGSRDAAKKDISASR